MISNFESPGWLLCILLVVALLAAYLWNEKRKIRRTLRFANMDMLERVAPAMPNPTRHIPIAILLASLVLSTLALSEPTMNAQVPRNKATIMLVIDVSLSMESTDVEPSRLIAAQDAAKSFVNELPPGINVGLVAFSGTASVLASPTESRENITAAIDNLKLNERTATGDAILAALQSVESFASILGESNEDQPAHIVLASDGKQTVPDAEDINNPRHAFSAARQAKDLGIPVSTISFGTPYGVVDIPDESGRSESIKVPVDDEFLEEISSLSGGSAFNASTLEELNSVYDTLRDQIGYQTERKVVNRPFFIAAFALNCLALLCAFVLRQRIP